MSASRLTVTTASWIRRGDVVNANGKLLRVEEKVDACTLTVRPLRLPERVVYHIAETWHRFQLWLLKRLV